MQTTRRVCLLGAMLLVPVLLAVAGGLLSAPAGPPKVDTSPVQLGPGPDGSPALGLEPRESPAPSHPSANPDPPPPAVETPPAVPVPAPAPPAAPIPVLPPVVIDDDDDDDGAPDDDAVDGEPDDE